MIYQKIMLEIIKKAKNLGMSMKEIARKGGIGYEHFSRALNGMRPIPRNGGGVEKYLRALKIPQAEKDDFRLSAEIGQRRIPDWVDIEGNEKEIMKAFRRWKK